MWHPYRAIKQCIICNCSKIRDLHFINKERKCMSWPAWEGNMSVQPLIACILTHWYIIQFFNMFVVIGWPWTWKFSVTIYLGPRRGWELWRTCRWFIVSSSCGSRGCGGCDGKVRVKLRGSRRCGVIISCNTQHKKTHPYQNCQHMLLDILVCLKPTNTVLTFFLITFSSQDLSCSKQVRVFM